MVLKLYHLASSKDGDRITREGKFHDSVLLTDCLPDEKTDSLENSLFHTYLDETLIAGYEVAGKDHREWNVPAEVVNGQGMIPPKQYFGCNTEIVDGEAKLHGMHLDVYGLESCRHFGTEEFFILSRRRDMRFCGCHRGIGEYYSRKKK